jgi:sugar phosphate isomerase/epimerase
MGRWGRIAAVGLLAMALLALPLTLAAPDQAAQTQVSAAQKLGWRLGSQAWTFNKLTFLEAADRVAELGMQYIEMYPGQRVGADLPDQTGPGMGPEATAAVKAKLQQKGLTLTSYGVTGLPGDEAACRAIFEWAKRMGVETIVAEPSPGDMPMTDKLCGEYGINVAIHNHPRPSRYWDPDTVLEACKGLSKRVGACADTGHWARSGLDPIECLKKLEGRIITVHFKDLNVKSRQGHDVAWGTGGCDAAGMLAELHRQGFQGVFSMEYEAKWEMPELAACVAFFNDQAALLADADAKAGATQ